MEINQVQMSNFGIVVVVIIGKPPLMGEVLCSTENSPFLIIDHIHAKINRVCCAALAIGKKCMNVRKNKLLLFHLYECHLIRRSNSSLFYTHCYVLKVFGQYYFVHILLFRMQSSLATLSILSSWSDQYHFSLLGDNSEA